MRVSADRFRRAGSQAVAPTPLRSGAKSSPCLGLGSGRWSVGDHAEPEGALYCNDFGPTTLLVVDNNKVNRDLMLGMFEKTHRQLRFAHNGKEALQRLDESKFDLVLLDIRMPVMDG